MTTRDKLEDLKPRDKLEDDDTSTSSKIYDNRDKLKEYVTISETSLRAAQTP
jgi:hypothetical protein